MNNVIYLLIHSNRKDQNLEPHSYIGSKVNYKPNMYWGSSKHPDLLRELSKNINHFQIQILEYVKNKSKINERELYWQKRYNAVEDKKFYNLSYANKKFTSVNFKWCYDPNTLQKGYFPKHKIPSGWIEGTKPKILKKIRTKTRLKKGDPLLEKIRSISNKKSAKRGLEHKDTKIWILQDPQFKKHKVIGLYPFCKKNNLLATALQYSFLTKKPIKKGKSKGWCVLQKLSNVAHDDSST